MLYAWPLASKPKEIPQHEASHLKISLLDPVRLNIDIPGYGLVRGAIGAVVEILGEPPEAYELDFNGCDGYTGPASFALSAHQVEPIS